MTARAILAGAADALSVSELGGTAHADQNHGQRCCGEGDR